jgi:hypothetical protein
MHNVTSCKVGKVIRQGLLFLTTLVDQTYLESDKPFSTQQQKKCFFVISISLLFVFYYRVTRDSLRDRRSGNQIPVEARFSTPIQTGPVAHPASYNKDTKSLFPGVMQPGSGVSHQPPFSV